MQTPEGIAMDSGYLESNIFLFLLCVLGNTPLHLAVMLGHKGR